MQRYFSNEKVNNILKLSNNDLHHIKNVMRMQSGDLIEVVYNQKLYICEVSIDDGCATIKKEEEKNNNDIDVTLVIPLLKEQKMDLIMQKATELGVTRIIPINTERSIIKLDDNKFKKKQERWQIICKEASEQSKRLTIPIVENIATNSTLKSLEGVKLVCSTAEKEKNLKFFLQTPNKCAKLVLVIGPEGGFTKSEEDNFVSCGFERVSLGNRIMRVETVPLFLLSIINYINME